MSALHPLHSLSARILQATGNQAVGADKVEVGIYQWEIRPLEGQQSLAVLVKKQTKWVERSAVAVCPVMINSVRLINASSNSRTEVVNHHRDQVFVTFFNPSDRASFLNQLRNT